MPVVPLLDHIPPTMVSSHAFIFAIHVHVDRYFCLLTGKIAKANNGLRVW